MVSRRCGQHGAYKRGLVGTSAHDVTAAIAACVAVLQGQAAPAPFAIQDQRKALLLLAHFAGDVHQPPHVGAVYLDGKGRRVKASHFASWIITSFARTGST